MKVFRLPRQYRRHVRHVQGVRVVHGKAVERGAGFPGSYYDPVLPKLHEENRVPCSPQPPRVWQDERLWHGRLPGYQQPCHRCSKVLEVPDSHNVHHCRANGVRLLHQWRVRQE